MRAAYLYGPLDVRVADAPTPADMRADEVLIEIALAGICGSELHAIEGYRLTPGATTPASAETRAPLGHEYSGVVTAIGPAVGSVRPGQRVTVVPRGPCGKCDLCRAGIGALCRNVTQRGQGGWANAILAAESLVYPLPDDVPLSVGAMTEPLSCAVRIVDRAGVRPGLNVCVIGAGPIGLFSAVLAKHAGAAKVIVSEPRASRRAMAARMGIGVVVDPRTESLYDAVMDHTGGRGAEVSIESVGLEPALSEALRVVAVGGMVLWGGLAPVDVIVPISPNDMFMREYTLRTSWGGVLEFERTIRLEQAIDWSPMAAEIFPLERAMDAVNYSRTEAAGKVLLRMQDDA
jgi:threonine dehydrogenase-like Zn-dependent dehydrogenase